MSCTDSAAARITNLLGVIVAAGLKGPKQRANHAAEDLTVFSLQVTIATMALPTLSFLLQPRLA